MNFAVVNLGCKVNRVESDDAAARLAACGVETPEAEADLIVVNTCTVTGEAEKKTRKAVRRALRANDRARVLVTGCAAAIDAVFYEALDARVTVVGKAQLADAIRDWCEACSSRSAAGEPADPANVSAVQAEGPAGPSRGAARGASETACAPIEQGDVAPLLHIGSGFRTRVGVKVQDGCDNACTYCIVHVARGRATSRPADEVVRECAAYARAGAGEIVLTGINLGSYCDGARRDPSATRLAGLLEDMAASDKTPAETKALIDRAGSALGQTLAGKVGAPVVAARRAGGARSRCRAKSDWLRALCPNRLSDSANRTGSITRGSTAQAKPRFHPSPRSRAQKSAAVPRNSSAPSLAVSAALARSSRVFGFS